MRLFFSFCFFSLACCALILPLAGIFLLVASVLGACFAGVIVGAVAMLAFAMYACVVIAGRSDRRLDQCK